MGFLGQIFGGAADPDANAPQPEVSPEIKLEDLPCVKPDGTLKTAFESASDALMSKPDAGIGAYGVAGKAFADHDSCVREAVQIMNAPKP